MPPVIRTHAGVQICLWNDNLNVTPDPDPKTTSYTHFDLSTEQLGQTGRYNCWGFTFIPRRYWICSAADVDNIIRDNCVPIADGSLVPGDVIRYRDDSGITTHTGRVWETDGAGHATYIRSKWGHLAEYIHIPTDVPSIYGTNRAYFRQMFALQGVADLWIKDSPADNGEQCDGGPIPWWVSPDILVDVPPYDGVPDENPVFNQVNRVWAVVTNRGDQTIDNAWIRYYWADPSAGLPPGAWHLIAATPGHPNPAQLPPIIGGSSIQAPYVEWTPTAAPAHQCLMAIAYVDDDPRDIGNPDPLVYSFEVPWDNNIAQRNVHVVELNSGGIHRFQIKIGNPFFKSARVEGSIHAVLTSAARLPNVTGVFKVMPLEVTVALKGSNKVRLKTIAGELSLQFRHEYPLLVALVSALPLGGKRPDTLQVEVRAPKNIKSGSVYYLHILQRVRHRITGGYTIAVIIK